MSAVAKPRAVSEEELRTWGARIRDPSAPLVERAHAMWGLRHAREPLATSLLAAYVTEVFPPEPASNALLQHEAAYCLGQRGDLSAVTDLEAALRDSRHEPIVRHEAAEGLAALASAPGVDVEHIKRVLTEFRDIDIVAVAETCEVGLGRIAWLQRPNKTPDPAAVLAEAEFPNTIDPSPAFDPDATPSMAELRRILLSPSSSLFARYQALFSLRNAAVVSTNDSTSSKHFSEVVEALSEALAAPGSALLRHEVAFILGQLSIAQTGDALIERLNDQQEAPMVRHEAAMALGEVAGSAEAGEGDCDANSLSVRARQALLAGCKDPEPVVRDSCALALDMADYVASNDRFQFAEVPTY
ncbi:Deoxyhypusine hydroxylase [Echinococcus granulosus]|uniref:Deoxyhypusine hydroxylase n=1 Tax=Echinococcus granulosus TaxID=6210 RepID=A0A068WLP6_ECHGR|nr:Deoxyhypusine hydroxylase [Echinococcus granulosus]CDS18585.1 deoxyhypusine hydroxylase:monooxygenase [Echinococcus granulosus]